MTLHPDGNDHDHDNDNERTPLLVSIPRKETPLPWSQLSILLFLQLSEPLTSQVIYPFAPQLIREVGITNGDETKVGYYVGVLQSAFFATQACTVLQWSRISDLVGRKPVLLTGLFGISLSMYSFGLSRSYWSLVFSRCINGALNGNIGVMKSMMVEFTDSTNVARAFAYMPIAWSTGSTLGPLLGGTLSRPAERFPSVFGSWQFMKDYPYFLACSIPATYSLVSIAVTSAYLKETVPGAVSFKSLLTGSKRKDISLPSSPHLKPNGIDPESPLPLRSLLTSRVLLATMNYAALSLVDIAFRGVLPIFFATPIEYGGLSFAPPTIGFCLSIFGLLNGLVQVFLFPTLHDIVGTRNLFLISLSSGVPVMALFPVMSVITRANGYVSGLVWFAIVFQLVLYVLFNMAYSCVFIYVAAASPNQRSIGATNGIAQMVVSIMRAVGPAFATSLYSLSIEHGYLGGWLVWYALLTLVFVSLVVGLGLPKQVWKRSGEL